MLVPGPKTPWKPIALTAAMSASGMIPPQNSSTSSTPRLFSSPTTRGNVAWHLTRALHQAGRCVDCLECERACPEGLPLGLLGRHVAQVVERRFGYRASADPSVPVPLGVYRTDDEEEFIV